MKSCYGSRFWDMALPGQRPWKRLFQAIAALNALKDAQCDWSAAT
jgi:hypothetical protein